LDLSLIGIDRVRGYFTEDAFGVWTRERGALASVSAMDAATLDERLRKRDVQVIDVRARSEWEAGHIDGSRNIPLGEIGAHASALADAGPVVVQCASGARSTIASSILLANGVGDVINLEGGLAAWADAGFTLKSSE
jgi:hydroxyacylglutathione hydrolase